MIVSGFAIFGIDDLNRNWKHLVGWMIVFDLSPDRPTIDSTLIIRIWKYSIWRILWFLQLLRFLRHLENFVIFLWFREIVDLVIFPEFSIVFKFVNFCDFLWFYEFYDFLEFDDLPSGIGMKLATCNAGKTCEFIGLFKRSKAKSE